MSGLFFNMIHLNWVKCPQHLCVMCSTTCMFMAKTSAQWTTMNHNEPQWTTKLSGLHFTINHALYISPPACTIKRMLNSIRKPRLDGYSLMQNHACSGTNVCMCDRSVMFSVHVCACLCMQNSIMCNDTWLSRRRNWQYAIFIFTTDILNCYSPKIRRR